MLLLSYFLEKEIEAQKSRNNFFEAEESQVPASSVHF